MAVTLVVDIIMDCVYNNNNFLVWLNSKSKERERESGYDMMTFDLIEGG